MIFSFTGPSGISSVIVENGTEGLSFGEKEKKVRVINVLLGQNFGITCKIFNLLKC
jgi:hypothetical protein